MNIYKYIPIYLHNAMLILVSTYLKSMLWLYLMPCAFCLSESFYLPSVLLFSLSKYPISTLCKHFKKTDKSFFFFFSQRDFDSDGFHFSKIYAGCFISLYKAVLLRYPIICLLNMVYYFLDILSFHLMV